MITSFSRADIILGVQKRLRVKNRALKTADISKQDIGTTLTSLDFGHSSSELTPPLNQSFKMTIPDSDFACCPD